jgi:hypothetical protein
MPLTGAETKNRTFMHSQLRKGETRNLSVADTTVQNPVNLKMYLPLYSERRPATANLAAAFCRAPEHFALCVCMGERRRGARPYIRLALDQQHVVLVDVGVNTK